MDDESRAILASLKTINDALLEGLKAAVFILENEKQISDERRLSLIKSIKELVIAGETAYGTVEKET